MSGGVDVSSVVGEKDPNYQQLMERELQAKEDQIAKLMAELQNQNQLVRKLAKNVDSLEKRREDKRERSQKAINETLFRLENNIRKFTKDSKRN